MSSTNGGNPCWEQAREYWEMLDDPDDYEEEDIPDEEDPQALTMREQREFAQASIGCVER